MTRARTPDNADFFHCCLPHIVNGREKDISLRNLGRGGVSEKVWLLLDASGKKLTNLKHSTVVPGAEESARGIWSAMHQPARGRR